MKSHNRASTSVYYSIAFGLLVYAYSPNVRAQDVGIGTFSDLVGEARQNFPQAQPTPAATPVLAEHGELKMLSGPAATPSPSPTPVPFISAPTFGLDYVYRRNQQKSVDGLTIDVDEAHTSFSFVVATTTKFAFEYVHIWSDGSNDIGGKSTVESNGLKMTVTQKIGDHFLFSFPIFYKDGDGDAVTTTGPQTFGADSFSMNPLLIFLFHPVKDRPLTLSLSPGYQVTITQKKDIRPLSPDVDGRTEVFSLLAGFEYAPANLKGENEFKIGASTTWNHLMRFYSSKPGPRLDDNSFALGGTLTYNFLFFPKTHEPRLWAKISYQFDGFNRDFSQHSVTASGGYRFW